jgi:ElaB/YqjD/DUF883 family membrane-anchored ribosome-binding protein
VTGDQTARRQAELESLAEQLDGIAEQLADLALDELQSAVAKGSTARPALERRVSRARRSVEKAAALLRDEPTSTLI